MEIQPHPQAGTELLPSMCLRTLEAGDFLPDVVFAREGERLHSAAFGGYPLALFLFRDVRAWQAGRDAVAQVRAALGEHLPVIEAVLAATEDDAFDPAQACYRLASATPPALFLGNDLPAARLLLLRRDIKIAWAAPLEQACQELAGLAPLAAKLAATGDGGTAPMLVVEQALPREVCVGLVEHFQRSEQKIQGRVGLSDPRYDPSRKRVSHVNLDPETARSVDRHLAYSLLPMIERCFGFRATHRVAYKIAQYDSLDHGFFHPHRDNSDPGTDYRRFAMSLALNEDWSGGGISFPEFGDQMYRIGCGNAMLFPVSLLHAVHPIQTGRRYVLLTFLYDEQGAHSRRATMERPELLDTTYPDAIAPALVEEYRQIYAPEPRFGPRYPQEASEPSFIGRWKHDSPMHGVPSRPSALQAVAQTPPQLYLQLLQAGFDAPTLAKVRDACLLAVQQTSTLLRGSGKPFSCHLVGVASLVAEAGRTPALVLAALLHAFYQPRVDGSDSDDERRARVLADFGEEVEQLLHAYHVAGPLLPGQAVPPVQSGREADVRILQLADQLEDGVDAGPWWHGQATDVGSERGSAGQRVDLLRGLAAAYAQAPLLGAPTLLARYTGIMDQWDAGTWPDGLRSGRYTSFRAVVE